MISEEAQRIIELEQRAIETTKRTKRALHRVIRAPDDLVTKLVSELSKESRERLHKILMHIYRSSKS
jgi:flagellin-specific chaperone FliS